MVKISNKKLKFKGQEIVKEILRIFWNVLFLTWNFF
jgi:hypothetical protein